MAEEKKENEEAEAQGGEEAKATGGKKRLIVIGGGAAGVLAAGVIAAMLAVPSKQTKPRFQGPFVAPLFEEQFSCNLKQIEHYIQMKPEIKYQVYDPSYLSVRTTDEAFKHEAWDAVHLISSNKSLDDLFSQADRDTFVAELRDTLDPVLFPAHIGSGKLPLDHDEASGLRPGLSADRATFRGYYYDHVLTVDGVQNTLQIDDGPVTTFEPGDPDVQVVDPRGSVLFVDVGGLSDGYVGKMNVGVKGRTLRVLPTGLIVQ